MTRENLLIWIAVATPICVLNFIKWRYPLMALRITSWWPRLIGKQFDLWNERMRLLQDNPQGYAKENMAEMKRIQMEGKFILILFGPITIAVVLYLISVN